MKNRVIIILLFFYLFTNQCLFSQEIEEDTLYVEDFKVGMTDTLRLGQLDSLSFLDTELLSTKSIFDRPYSLWEHQPDKKRLKKNSFLLLGSCIGAAGILYLLPEGVSKWDKETISFNSMFSDWWHNVRSGPVVDKDDFAMNYLAHPYCGAIYYMAARSAGCNVGYSFLYSFVLSTFFWEYGIEAFAEVPSWQDIIITPVGGALLGETFYLAKRQIVNNDYYLLNSKILGHTATFLMDPLNEVFDLFSSRNNKNKESNVSLYSFPKLGPDGLSYHVSLSMAF